MDTNKRKPAEQATNVRTARWRSVEFRKMVVKKITDAVIKLSGLSQANNLSGLVKKVERFEERVNAAAKNEAEYIAMVSAKVKSIYSRTKIAETKPHPSNSSSSGDAFFAQEAGKSSNIEWKEQVYLKVQKMKSTYFTILNGCYQQITSKLQQLESSPQVPKTIDLEKIKKKKEILEYILALLRVHKNQITTEFEENLDKAEKFIESSGWPKNVSSLYQGQQLSADGQSRQLCVPSHSSTSHMEILEMESSTKALGTQNYYMTKDNSQQNKMYFQEQQVAKQYSNSKKDVNQLSTIECPGSAVQRQIQGVQRATQAFSVSVNTLGISADGQPRQLTVPSHCSTSQMEILEMEPSPKALGTRKYHMTNEISQQNKMCLQEQQVGKQYSNSQQDVNQLSTTEGPGSAVQRQTQGVQRATQAFSVSVNTLEISADGQPRQLTVPSHFSTSQMEILELEPSPKALGTRNYHMTNEISQQNKMCLQEQQLAKQYSNSQQEVNQLSIKEGPGSAIQQQTQGAQKATEAFSVNVNALGISASSFSHKPTLVSDEPSAAMRRFLKVLTSMSSEALSASIGEIREIVNLNDAIPTSELIDGPAKMKRQTQPRIIPQAGVGPPKSVTGKNLASSQARFVTCNDFVPIERKLSDCMNAMAFDTSRISANSCDRFNQSTDSEKPDLTLVTSEVKCPRIVEQNCSLLEEIKVINNQLIDSEVVIVEKDIIEARGAAEDEGLVVKFLFNAVTVNLNLICHLAAHKKSIIKPLRLHVPRNYPFSSPVILDKMPLEVSEGLKDLSTIAKSKLRVSLQNLNQPWSLGDIAISWELCARKTILEYAQGIGGGTFSSKYGGWEMS